MRQQGPRPLSRAHISEARRARLWLFQEFLNRRKMTEFGNLALIDQDAGEEDGVAIPLPGVKKGEQGSPAPPRAHPPEVELQWEHAFPA